MALIRAIAAVLYSHKLASWTAPTESDSSGTSSDRCSGSFRVSTRYSNRNFSSCATRKSDRAARTTRWPSLKERTQIAARTSATRARSLFDVAYSEYAMYVIKFECERTLSKPSWGQVRQSQPFRPDVACSHSPRCSSVRAGI